MIQDPLVGRVLNRQYRVLRKIGSGGFGSVYEAQEPRFERKVAIKTIHPTLTQNPVALERFRREGLAASRLDHPAAVKVFNLGQTDDGIVYMVMELLDGKSISEVIAAQGPLSLREVAGLLEPICEVLAEAHAKGILHRDLKPRNIMLVSTARGFYPKVLDFGISRIATEDSLTSDSIILGTPAYMAPEQWQEGSPVDHRVDIYALALITYKCLSGRLPFEANNSSEWMKKHCTERPKHLQEVAPELPGAICEVVMRALAKDPAARHQSTLDFYQSFSSALEDHESDTIPVPEAPNKDELSGAKPLALPIVSMAPEKLSLPTLLKGDAQDPALVEALQKDTNEAGKKLAEKLSLENKAAPTVPVRRIKDEDERPPIYRRPVFLGVGLLILLFIAYLLGRVS